MANKYKTKNDNVISFRAPSKEEKEKLKKLIEETTFDKSMEKFTIYELVKAGIEVSCKSTKEKNLLLRRNRAKTKRDDLLYHANQLNAEIQALNRQLIDKYPKRYENINELVICNEDNKRIDLLNYKVVED